MAPLWRHFILQIGERGRLIIAEFEKEHGKIQLEGTECSEEPEGDGG